MQAKKSVVPKCRYLARWLILIINVLFVFGGYAQPTKQDIPTQRLLLQLAACYLNVAKQNQIDIDSGLALACQRSHLNPLIVIGEDFEDIILDPANSWVPGQNIGLAKEIALSSIGPKQISLLNLIGFFYVFQPAERKNDLDSAILYLSMAKKAAESSGDKKSYCQSLCGLGKVYLERGDFPLASSTFTAAIKQAAQSGYKKEEEMAWIYWATFIPFNPNTISDRISQLNKANALSVSMGNTRHQISNFNNIGYLCLAAGKINEAKQSFEKAVELGKAINFPYVHYSLDKLAFIGFITGDHESHLRYAIANVKTVESTRDSIVLGYIYARRADAELFYSDKQQGMEWSKKALAEFMRIQDPGMYITAFNFTSELVREGKSREAIILIEKLLKKYPPLSPLDRQNLLLTLAKAYESTNYSRAERFYLEAISIQKEVTLVNANNNHIVVYQNIARFYFRNGQYNKSRNFLNSALKFSYDNVDKANYADIHRQLAKVDSATGNFKNAYNHIVMATNISDSLNANANNKQVAELRVQYETEKKDNSIKLLNHQAALQQEQIKQEKFTKNVMIAGGAILILFLGLLYNRYRIKQKTNHQLEAQQKVITQKNNVLEQLLNEKEWLLKEVHHRVKNNLQIIISLLNNQSKYLKNDAAVDAIRESQQRLYAISLIHQKLYKAEDSATINMHEYVYELVAHLKNGVSTPSQVKFDLNIMNIQLDVAQAVPLGLILNEAISNAFKYAFTPDRPGKLLISFKHLQNENEFQLIVADNGPGLPQDYNISTAPSFGIRLMQGLSKQLLGHIDIRNDNGLAIELLFKDSNVINLMREQDQENQVLKRIV